MLTGKKVVLRPMQAEDINRQHAFNQDLELYGLDSTYPRVSPVERATPFTSAASRLTTTSLRLPSKPMVSTSGIAA